jgi:hypothetical protein
VIPAPTCWPCSRSNVEGPNLNIIR